MKDQYTVLKGRHHAMKKTTKHETQQNKPKTKQAKEQQLKQNKEVIAGDTGPYSTLQENGVP